MLFSWWSIVLLVIFAIGMAGWILFAIGCDRLGESIREWSKEIKETRKTIAKIKKTRSV